jgi:hypothetical protein
MYIRGRGRIDSIDVSLRVACMRMNVNSMVDSRCFFSKRVLSVVSLLFVLVIVSYCFVSASSGISLFVLGAPGKDYLYGA